MNCQNDSNNMCPEKLKLSREKEDPCRASLLDISIEFHDGSLQLSCLIKDIPFPFISIACPIWIAHGNTCYPFVDTYEKAR